MKLRCIGEGEAAAWSTTLFKTSHLFSDASRPTQRASGRSGSGLIPRLDLGRFGIRSEHGLVDPWWPELSVVDSEFGEPT